MANGLEFNGVEGTAEDDVLRGSPSVSNIIMGMAGNDLLLGGGKASFLMGDDGNDELKGRNSNDVLFGGNGMDSLFGGNGRDLLSGGADADRVDGGKGNDVLHGGSESVTDTLIGGAGADKFVFDFDALDGVDAEPAKRNVTGGEDFITDYQIGTDTHVIDAAAFGIEEQLSFFTGLASELPSSGVNVIVLQDTDNDNNPATAFNAGSAASLIAGQIDEAGAGFFLYFNSALGVNRLVYSEDLNDPTADLQIIARYTNATGADAIANLAAFGEADFAFVNDPMDQALANTIFGEDYWTA